MYRMHFFPFIVAASRESSGSNVVPAAVGGGTVGAVAIIVIVSVALGPVLWRIKLKKKSLEEQIGNSLLKLWS